MKKTAVLHVLTSLDFGGVETRMKLIALNGDASRYDHQFCAIANGGAIFSDIEAAGRSVTLLNKRSRIPSFSALFALIGKLRADRPAIVHCHGAEANFHGLIAGRIAAVPVCISEEIGLATHSAKARMMFRWVYRLADSVVAISEVVKRRIVDLGESDAVRCQVIFNIAQMLAERRVPTPSDRFRIGFVGRLEEVKNPIALVRAVSLLRDKGLDIALTIVGDGNQKTTIEEEIGALGLAENVVLAGFDARPFDRLSDVDLYVQPSISEGFCLALVEAMSMGIPVLATAVGGVPEIISDEENGWVLSGAGPKEIADSIAKLAMVDKSTLETVGKKGRNSVIDRFSPSAFFAASDAHYDRLLATKVS